MMRSLTWIGGLAVASILLTGCGSLQLHSETREKQGQAAVAAWKEVDLKGFFAAERENEAKILAQELASTQKLSDVRREMEVRKLARTRIGELPALYDEALRPLVSTPGGTGTLAHADFEPHLQKARNAQNAERRFTQQFERDLSFLREMGAPRFTCAQLLDKDQTIVDAWKRKEPQAARAGANRLRIVVGHCGNIEKQRQDFRDAVARFTDGSIRSTANALKNSQDSLARRQGDVDKERKAYEIALAAYEKEVESAKAGKSTAQKSTELAEKAASALKAVEKVNSALSDEFVSEERIARIDALITSLKAGTPVESEDASKAEIAISFLPTIAEDIRAIGQARKGRAAVPLLIQRDIELARLNAAKARLANEEQDRDLHDAALRATLSRASSYVNARNRVIEPVLDTAAPPPPPGQPPKMLPSLLAAAPGATVAAAWQDLKPDQRVVLLESTNLYLDAFGRQQAEADAATTRRLALSKDRAIAMSEINAGMWASLIGATVDQAAEFSALGIKASDIAPILNVLGVFYIGHGVNK